MRRVSARRVSESRTRVWCCCCCLRAARGIGVPSMPWVWCFSREGRAYNLAKNLHRNITAKFQWRPCVGRSRDVRLIITIKIRITGVLTYGLMSRVGHKLARRDSWGTTKYRRWGYSSLRPQRRVVILITQLENEDFF